MTKYEPKDRPIMKDLEETLSVLLKEVQSVIRHQIYEPVTPVIEQTSACVQTDCSRHTLSSEPDLRNTLSPETPLLACEKPAPLVRPGTAQLQTSISKHGKAVSLFNCFNPSYVEPQDHVNEERAVVLNTYEARWEDELDIKKDQTVIVVDKYVGKGWWMVILEGKEGLVPEKCVQLIRSETTAEGFSTRRTTNVSLPDD